MWFCKININLIKDPDLERLISPIKRVVTTQKNQLLAIYQGVHITYFTFSLFSIILGALSRHMNINANALSQSLAFANHRVVKFGSKSEQQN